MVSPPPATVGIRGTLTALQKALYETKWSVLQYDKVAKNEKAVHLPHVGHVRDMFTQAANVIGAGSKKLNDDTVTLSNSWTDDKNFGPAFEEPVAGYLSQLEKSKARLAPEAAGGGQPGGGAHMAALTNLIDTMIPQTAQTVADALTEHNTRMDSLRRLEIEALTKLQSQEDSMRSYGDSTISIDYAEADKEIDALETVDTRAFRQLEALDTAYANTAKLIRDAAAGHTFNGPAAGEAPTDPNRAPSAPGPGSPTGPSATPPGGGPQPGQQPGGGDQQQPGGGAGAQPPGGGAGEQPPGGGAGDPTAPGSDTPLPDDTGLASAPPSTLPPTTVPDLPSTNTPNTPNLPGSTSPSSSSPLGGVGGSPLAAGLGGSSRPGTGTGGTGTPNVQQAARNLSAPQGGGTGQAPALGRLATGSAGQAGSGFGGVPPMMPPMMPQTGSGNGKPKPGTAPATGAGRNRPAGGSAGVPAGLRGRTAAGGDGPRRPTARRVRQEPEQATASQPNQNADLLDSELWEVDQPSPVTERRRVREN